MKSVVNFGVLFSRRIVPIYKNASHGALRIHFPEKSNVLFSHGHHQTFLRSYSRPNVSPGKDDASNREDTGSRFKRPYVSIPKNLDEYRKLKEEAVVSPENSRLLRVALLGLPNAGKSTLTNRLMRWRVCTVSKKVHTTRRNTKAVYVDGVTQIIFTDTPGLISATEMKKHHLTQTMLNDPEESVMRADIVAILIDASNLWARYKIDPKIMQLLTKYPEKKSILILNKIDLVKNKRLLLDLVDSLTTGVVGGQRSVLVKEKKKKKVKTAEELIENTIRRQEQQRSPTEEDSEALSKSWPKFAEVFFISALKDDGVKDLREHLLKSAPSGPWLHPQTFVTNQQPESIIREAVMEKLMDALPKEIPYQLKVKVETLEENEGFTNIVVSIDCPRPNIPKLIIGPGGKYVARIAEEARQSLMNTFRTDVVLKLAIQCKSSKTK